jgi:hypothetical protein
MRSGVGVLGCVLFGIIGRFWGVGILHLTVLRHALAKERPLGLRVRLISGWKRWRVRFDCHAAALVCEIRADGVGR